MPCLTESFSANRQRQSQEAGRDRDSRRARFICVPRQHVALRHPRKAVGASLCDEPWLLVLHLHLHRDGPLRLLDGLPPG